MESQNTTLQSLGEIAIASIPVVGYYSGHSKGVQEGYEHASNEYEKKMRVLRDRMKQIKRDVLGDNEIFVYPAGWDEEYWLKILSDFINEYSNKKSNGKELLLGFIDLCLEKFPQDKLAETCHQLKTIRNVLTAAPSSRISLDKGDLELAIHFLDVFGRPFDWENKVENPSMSAIANELIQVRDEIKSAMTNIKGCNFLVLGKTGTGKSSLLNYLVDRELFKADVGKPVTPKGIHPQSAWIDNLKVTVYDSWGLESGDSFENWHEMLENEKQKHDLRQDVSEWFHSIVYCIQASGARIEGVDIDIIKSFLDEKYHVVVVLTKADLCSEEDEEILRRTLLESCKNLNPKAIVGVCSEEKNVRGVVHQKFGRDKLKEEVMTGYIGTIVSQLPKRCVYLGVQELEKFCENIKQEIKKRSMWSDDNEGWLKGKCEDFIKNFNKEVFPKIIRDEILTCATISQSLASAIDYNCPYFPDNDLINEFDKWYMKTLKVIGYIFLTPIAIFWGLFEGTKWEHEKLEVALMNFIESTRKSIEEQEEDIRKKLKSAIGYQEGAQHVMKYLPKNN